MSQSTFDMGVPWIPTVPPHCSHCRLQLVTNPCWSCGFDQDQQTLVPWDEYGQTKDPLHRVVILTAAVPYFPPRTPEWFVAMHGPSLRVVDKDAPGDHRVSKLLENFMILASYEIDSIHSEFPPHRLDQQIKARERMTWWRKHSAEIRQTVERSLSWEYTTHVERAKWTGRLSWMDESVACALDRLLMVRRVLTQPSGE